MSMNTGTEVFSINFIRRPFIPLSTKRLLIRWILIYVLVQIVLIGLLFLVTFAVNLKTNKLEQKISKSISPLSSSRLIKSEMNNLKIDLSVGLNRLRSLIELEKSRFQIADKLAGLARTLPSRTWITGLSGNQGPRTLAIKAAYAVDSKDQTFQPPTKEWFAALRSDPDFGQGIKRIELQKTSERRQGNAKIYVFDVLAEW